jgi:hypothetical protein
MVEWFASIQYATQCDAIDVTLRVAELAFLEMAPPKADKPNLSCNGVLFRMQTIHQ